MRTGNAEGFALGIDLGGTKIEALLLQGGAEVWRHRVATPGGSYAATLEALHRLIQAARQQAAAPITVGIGTPGALTHTGVMKNANSVVLNGRPLKSDLESLIGQPVRMANDANCLALSEATDGAAAGAEVVFAAILGTGCGAGITVRGQLLTGPNSLAGEWGHNPLPWADAETATLNCYCGRLGCNETLLSGSGISRDHQRRTGEQLAATEIAQRASLGDASCQLTLERHTEHLARALAAVINLLDPDVVVLGGGVSRMAHLYERVPKLWQRHVVGATAADPVRTRLVASQHGDASGVRGAAWLWRF